MLASCWQCGKSFVWNPRQGDRLRDTRSPCCGALGRSLAVGRPVKWTDAEIWEAMRRCGGNAVCAGRLLGMHPVKLRERIRRAKG